MCIFRSMTKRDAGIVFDLEKDLFSDPWPRISFFNEPFENEAAFAYVVEQGREIVGYIMGWYIEREIHISNIAVVKKCQGQGIGSFILKKLLNLYNDYESCFLEVRESNHIAQKLYMKFGFNIISLRKAYYSNGENALILSKHKSKSVG